MLTHTLTREQDGLPPQASARGLRVAIVSDAAPERNGVGAYYRDLAEHLREAGARVELVAPRFRGGHWYGGLALPLPGDPTQRILLPSPALVSRRLARLSPDVVVVPTPGPYGMLGLHLARRSGAAVVVGFHTDFERLTGLFQAWRLRGPIYKAYLKACHRVLFSRGDLVLANSDAMVEEARRIGARQVGLMATPIPKRFLHREPSPSRARLERVLFAGRLAPEKNLALVVEAARRLPDIRFLIAGDGPLRPWIQEQCRSLPNLTQVGWVTRARVLDLLDSVDALVLPSQVESFGTIALEAMARARIVLVSPACGILSWELLRRGLFQIRGDEHLADALGRLRDLDPALRERKAGLAREAAIEINRRNLDHWLAILSGDHGRCVDAGR